MEEKFKCPRCGFEQSPTEDCRKCGINIPKYIELQKRRRIVPSGRSQRPQAEGDQRPGVRPPPGKTQGPHDGSDQQPKKEGVPPKPSEISPHRVEGVETGGELPGIGELFRKSWEIYKSRIGKLISLYLLSAVFFAASFGIFIGIGYIFSLVFPDSKAAFIISGGLVGTIAGIIAMFSGLAAFVFAVVDKSLGIKDALKRGWQRLGAFIWLFSLLGFIITGGFLLFLIPGVIFVVWFVFAQFILADDDERGMNALLKSKGYVKGHSFDVFLRLFVIWLISVVIGIVQIIGQIIGTILYILFVPFMMIFIYVIYQDLRALKGDVAYFSSAGEKFKWIGTATLGYVVLPLIVIAVMGASLITSLFLLKEILKSY